jgi:hypothetical protein
MLLNKGLYYAETNLDNAFSVQIQNVGVCILDKGVVRGPERLCTMTANQQNLCSFPGFCPTRATTTPYNDTTGGRAVKLCFRTDVHVLCRTCRTWYRICVVASISMWQGNGTNVCSPSLPWVSHTHSKHGRCGNGFVCVNVFESGVYHCTGCRSGDRIQEINRRKAVVLRVRL